jgi:hypothetical protein
MLERWADNADLTTAHRLTRACVLAPDAVRDPGRLVRMADRVVALDPARREWQVLRGAAYFRAGRYREARVYLETAIRPMPDSLSTKAWGNLYLAMTLDGLGQEVEARRCLDRAGRWIDREIPERHDGTARNPALNWDEQLLFPLLRREAAAQIEERRPLYLPANVFQVDSDPDRAAAATNR